MQTMEKQPIFKKATFNKILKDKQDDRKPKAAFKKLLNTENNFIKEINQLLDQYNFN